VRLLFYKPDMAWPRASGHDVHTYNMMRSMSRLGARIGLVTRTISPPQAIAGVDLDLCAPLSSLPCSPAPLTLRRLEERYRSYWGTQPEDILRFAQAATRFQADAVVVSGLDVLPMLGAVEHATRVWYAADEWFWHHISQVEPAVPSSWSNVRDALVKGLYERAHRHRLDRVWVVSRQDARAMTIIAGARAIDVLPNGVDVDWYRPLDVEPDRETAVFWGRLDFGPNIQALEWFCRRVWPAVVAARPRARFTIFGFNPSATVSALAGIPGVSLQANLEDLRGEVARHEVVVLPFVSGGGIKNKLLEAAAMGKPIVCSRRALLGLQGEPPVAVADNPQAWVAALTGYWDDVARQRTSGRALRDWVEARHSWAEVAARALAGLAGPHQITASDAAWRRAL
jgi:glycosyltransferase involved in cell wall biosynthesis